MTIEHEISINQYGQDLLSLEELMQTSFLNLSNEYQRMYLNDVVNLIIQSKPKYEDVSLAIKTSQLKETYTPCVLLRKGISYAILSQIASLPNNEREKSAKLLLSLFKIAYRRRFLQETQTTHKWWYKDLSVIVDEIKKRIED